MNATKPERNEREAFDALRQVCPPCNGRCRQGRDCPADSDARGNPLDQVAVRWVLVALGVFWACAIATIGSCTR